MLKTTLLLVLFVHSSRSWLILGDINFSDVISYGDGFSNDSKPLFLTPFINDGKIEEAKNAARVPPLVNGTSPSYSGFLTVDKRYESNMFFWYFPAEASPETAPVIVWLQGGPGASSMFGLFFENGVYKIDKNGDIIKRDVYWSKTMHVIYIDNPVGTGFSFTKSNSGFSRDEVSVGKNLYEAIQQFFILFPELRNNDFFVAGESYAGKYIPALGYTIHIQNPSAKNKINLKGLAIGDGLVDPINQLNYGDYLYGIGLIDSRQRQEFTKLQLKIQGKIRSNDWIGAFRDYSYLITGTGNSLFMKSTGYTNVYNYLKSQSNGIDGMKEITALFSSSKLRDTIHVGNQDYKYLSGEVYNYILPSFFRSMISWMKTLADNYKILVYNGQMDIILGYPMAGDYLSKMEWCGREQFLATQRTHWSDDDGRVAGYIQTSAPPHCNGSLSFALVRNAGHMVPQNQPVWAYLLISKFTSNKSG